MLTVRIREILFSNRSLIGNSQHATPRSVGMCADSEFVDFSPTTLFVLIFSVVLLPVPILLDHIHAIVLFSFLFSAILIQLPFPLLLFFFHISSFLLSDLFKRTNILVHLFCIYTYV